MVVTCGYHVRSARSKIPINGTLAINTSIPMAITILQRIFTGSQDMDPDCFVANGVPKLAVHGNVRS